MSEHTDVDLTDQTDEAADKKTRKEKTAEKLGISTEELDERKKSGVTAEEFSALKDALSPLIENAKAEKLKKDFGEQTPEGDYETFKKEYDSLIAIGADPEKAKERALSISKESAEAKKEEVRKEGKESAGIAPSGDHSGGVQGYQKLSREAFAKLLKVKGADYYKKYCAHFDAIDEKPYQE